MKLYLFPGACSLAPHIVLEDLHIEFEPHCVDLMKGQGQTPEYLAINPVGAVPVLELDNGQRISEVQVILQYLAELKPEAGLMGPDRWALKQWLSFVSTELHKSFYNLFFAGRIHSDTTAQEQLRQAWTQRLKPRWSAISTQLGSQEYLLGPYTLVDSYLFTVMQWCRMVKVDLSDWVNLDPYLDRMRSRPAVQAALQREKGLKS